MTSVKYLLYHSLSVYSASSVSHYSIWELISLAGRPTPSFTSERADFFPDEVKELMERYCSKDLGGDANNPLPAYFPTKIADTLSALDVNKSRKQNPHGTAALLCGERERGRRCHEFSHHCCVLVHL
jgi:hypothetical protein